MFGYPQRHRVFAALFHDSGRHHFDTLSGRFRDGEDGFGQSMVEPGGDAADWNLGFQVGEDRLEFCDLAVQLIAGRKVPAVSITY